MRLSRQQIKYALSLSDNLSFRKAADACFISQPTLSSAIKAAEECIGEPLFIRGKQVTVTDAMKQLVPTMRKVANLFDQIESNEVESDSLKMIASQDGEQLMSSREISELTGVRHDNVLRTVRSLLADQILTPQYEEIEYRGRQLPTYNLNQRDSTVLVARLSPEFTAKVVDRWRELEQLHKVQLPDFGNPAEAARAWALEYEQKKTALLQIEQDKPKVEFAESVKSAGNDIEIGDAAKQLGVGPNKLRDWLRENKVIRKRRDGYYEPYQRYMDGRFGIDTRFSKQINQHYPVVVVKPRGFIWLEKKVRGHFC